MLPILTFAVEPICDIENTKKIYLQLDSDDREVRTKFFRNLDSLLQLAKQRGTEITDGEMAVLLKPMNDSDARNQALLDQIVASCGWPSYANWGATPVYAATIVALHSPVAFRKKYFPNVEASFNRGEVTKELYAQYVDKMLTSENQPQRYGTQQFSIKGAPAQLRPVEAPAHLNDRRQAIGLKPLVGFPMPTNWPDSQPPTKAEGAAPATTQ